MVAILCAVLASCTLSQKTESSDGIDARGLYLQASQAIADGYLLAAIERLEALTGLASEAALLDVDTLEADPPVDSSLAPIAAFHLAECYLLTDRPHDALRLLIQWSSKIADSSTAKMLQPGILDQVREVAVHSCESMARDEPGLRLVQRYLEQIRRDDNENDNDNDNDGEDDASSTHRSWVTREVARRQIALAHYADAIEGLRTLGEAADEQVRYKIPLRWAHRELELGHRSEAIRILTECSEAGLPQPPQAAAVALLLSEAYIANGQPQRALDGLTALSEALVLPSDTPADWEASIAVRRAELLILSRRWREATGLLRAAKDDYPAFDQHHEFDYLLARCAIADADFDLARQHLQLAAHAPTAARTDAVARAMWMIGETHFLQRNHQQALSVYQQVISLDGARRWRTHALLQAAKCLELLGQPTEAMAAYEKIEDEDGSNDSAVAAIVSEASFRLAILRARHASPSVFSDLGANDCH